MIVKNTPCIFIYAKEKGVSRGSLPGKPWIEKEEEACLLYVTDRG